MKIYFALTAAVLLACSSAVAQSPSSPSAQAPVHQTPGAAAPATAPSQSSSAGQPAAPSATVTVTPEEEKSIRRLMALLGTDKIALGLDQSISVQLRDAMTQRGMSGDKLKQFLQDFDQGYAAPTVDNKVNTAIVQTFAAHLSADDIKGLVQFYESPLGDRFMNALPYITQSMQQEGARIVREQAIATLRQMTDQYPEVKSLIPPDSSAPPSSAEPPVRPVPDQPPHLGSSDSQPSNPGPSPQN